MIDKLNASDIEIVLDELGKVWINVDGECVVRIGRVERAVVEMGGKTVVQSKAKWW